MSALPKIKILKAQEELEQFQTSYFGNAKLEVPMEYLQNNQVFAFILNGKQVGGFVLGTDQNFRTVEFFASAEKRAKVSSQIKKPGLFSELCCFWIDPEHKCKTRVNLAIWFLMSLTLKKNSRQFLLFGTCSKGLAKLYSSTRHSVLIHKDRVNRNATFIFIAKRSICISGIMEIILKKMKRLILMKLNWKIAREDHNLELRLVADENVPSYFSERNKWQKIRI
ncbi:MAG: hypothetical protein AAF502_19565 [Bacteroidota bacterium]